MLKFYTHISYILFYLCSHGLYFSAFQVIGSHGDVIQVSETDTKGKVLLNETGRTSCNVSSVWPKQNKQYVKFNDQNSLVILEVLDLEVLKLQGNSSTLTVQYACDGAQKKNITLNIIPVNEFKPIFLNSPYSSKVKEGNVNGSEVLYLGDKWKDSDKVKYNLVSSFRLHPYVITAFDGKDYFRLDEITGNLTTNTVFDYESKPPRTFFMLNISIEDDGGEDSKTAFSTVNVTVEDIDDNPPVFTKCKFDISNPCHVTEYSATIDRFFQGILTVSPDTIYAEDKDRGVNARILYKIENEDEIGVNIQMDNHTGEVEVIVPFANLTDWASTEILNISLRVMAIEESTNSHRTNITLTVIVYRVMPTTSMPTKITSPSSTQYTSDVQPTEQPSSQFDTLLLVEIIVPVCAVIALTIIVVCVLWKRKKKQRDTRYQIRESQRDVNVRKSENFEYKNIDVISSTPVGPYELVSNYARMDSNDKNGDSPRSSKTENREASGDDSAENGENNVETTDEMAGEDLEERFYAKVDKRKQRKRQKQALVIMDHTSGKPEEVNEHESDDSVSGPNFDNINDTRESATASCTEHNSDGEHQVYEIPDINIENAVNETSESPDTSHVETGNYRNYENVESY